MYRFWLSWVVMAASASLYPAALADEAPILQIETGGNTSLVRWLCFTPDGNTLLSAGDDKVLRVWDVADPAHPRLARSMRYQIGPGHEGKILAAALSPDGRTIFLGGFFDRDGGERAGDVRVVDLQTGQVLAVLGDYRGAVHSMAVSPDGAWLAAGGDLGGTLRVWDVRQGLRTGDWSGVAKTRVLLEGHESAIYALAFASNDRLVSGGDDRTLRLWKLGEDGWAIKAVAKGHEGEIRRLAISSDGRKVATVSFDKTVRLWDARTGEELRTLGTHDARATAVAFSPDGRTVVSGGGDNGPDYVCRVWDVSGEGEPVRFAGHDNSVQCITFNPAGTLVASAGGNSNDIHLWDPTTGKSVGHIAGTGRSVWTVAFSPDGSRVAFGNASKGDATLLEKSFDLAAAGLGTAADLKDTQWVRGPLTLGTRSARTDPRAINTLTVLDGGEERFKVSREHPYNQVQCYAFTPAGDVVVGSNFNLTLNDGRTGQLKKEFLGHTGVIWSVAVSPDGRYLLSGSDDQTFSIWGIESGERLLTVFVGNDDQWVAWTPQGYYKSSSGGDRLIGWQINKGRDQAAQFYYAWQLRRRFERPEVVERVMEAGSVEEAVKLAEADPHAKKQGNETVADLARIAPPTVDLTGPADGSSTEAETVHLEASILPNASSGEALKEVKVLVNGRPVPTPRAVPAGPKGTKGLCVVALDVPLVEGDNEVSVIAASDSSTSAPVKLKVHRDAKHAAPKPDLYVLAVGVSDYSDARLNLKWAARDAEDLGKAMARQEGGLFGRVQAKVLVNDKATRREVLKGLKWLGEQVTQRDVAMVLISGHGTRDERGAYYFVPYDAETDDVASTCLHWGQLTEKLAGLPCKVLLAMDTCHSGAVTGPGRKGTGDLSDVIKELTAVESGVVVMSSSTGRELSEEREDWGHGAFALALIEGLGGRRVFEGSSQTPLPTGPRGVVDLAALDDYVTHRVKEVTGGSQHPVTDRGNIPSFPLAVVGNGNN